MSKISDAHDYSFEYEPRSSSADGESLLHHRHLVIDCPPNEKHKDDNHRKHPKPNGRLHAEDADECDEGGTACAPKDICNKELAGSYLGKACHITHQVAGEDGQDKGKEEE